MNDLALSRRTLLKAGLAGVSSLALGGGLLVPCGPGAAGEAGLYVSLATGRTLRGTPSTCALCPAGCGILGFTNERGELEGVAGNPAHPVNRGSICGLGSSAVNLAGSPLRVRTPLRRAGERGGGAWEAVSWDRALSDLADALDRGLRRAGEPGIGPAVCVPERRLSCFLERFAAFFPGGSLEASDGYELEVERAAHRAFSGGAERGIADLERADLVLLFGADPLGSVRQLLAAGRIWSEAVRNGARWIALDPRLSETAAACGRWVPIRPGTDGAFASAVACRLLESGRADRGFLARLPAGEAERVRRTLAGWSPERAARVCGVPAETVRRVAGEFAGAARPVAVFGSGVTGRQHGERDARAVLLLNFLAGGVDREGGYRLAEAPWWPQPGPPMPRAPGPARPGTLFRDLMLGRRSVDTLITWDADPAATDPGGAGTSEVLKSTERVPFHASLATVWNETVHLADLVLPAASFLGEWGLSAGVVPWDGSAWLGLRRPVFRARVDARPAEEVLLRAVRMLGGRARDVFPFPDMETYYRAAAETCLSGRDPAGEFRLLESRGFVPLARAPGPGGAGGGPGLEDGRPAGAGEVAGLAVPAGAYPAVESGPAAATGDRAELRDPGSARGERGPAVCEMSLLLFGSPLQGPAAAGLEWVEELEHERPLWMHPDAAREAGFAEGDRVRVRGPSGEVRTRVRLTQGLRPETVAMRSAGAGVAAGPSGLPAPPVRGRGPARDRVWWARRAYGENARKLVPWPPQPDGGSPGWQDTRVTIVKERGG